MVKRAQAVVEPARAQVHLRATLAEIGLLMLLALLLFNTNHSFTFIDDETNILGPAARPTGVFFSSLGELLRGHEHPPLFDILLHFWLRATGGAIDWLRVPSVLFYLAGVFLLSRAARILADVEGSTALLWIGALSPYGFHFGRLAGWYSFAFFLIAGLTWSYLQYAACLDEGRDASACRAAWIRTCIFGIALVYTNYFGWALVGLLAIDDFIRHRSRPGTFKRLGVTAAIFVVAYAPLWGALWNELTVGTTLRESWRFRLFNLAYNVYVLCVSEAMAPWFWRFGIPAALAVAGTLLLTLFGTRGAARRLLIYAGILVAAMALGGFLYPRRLFMVAPWMLLAIAVGIGTVRDYRWRSGIALCLGLVAAAGWYGFFMRDYYATPRFFEPWDTVAQEAADTVRGGGMVIANNPSFLFYLTYALEIPPSPSGFHFSGVVTQAFQHPQIWDADSWEKAGRPVRSEVFWVSGMPEPAKGGPMETAKNWLDTRCTGGDSRYLTRDPSFEAKQKFAPEIDQIQWRIALRRYSCGIEPPAAARTAPSNTAPIPPVPLN